MILPERLELFHDNHLYLYLYLKDSTKLALANVSDVDYVVPRILQQLQPGEDAKVKDNDECLGRRVTVKM